MGVLYHFFYRCKYSVPASEQMSQKEKHDLELKEGTKICKTSFDILNKYTPFRPCLFNDFLLFFF